ncbi:FYN-binding -like [Pelobates cultripes]|uniref:FYN-binding -like n=1 Tax=Pelobates cultripes TaxID=61616 RepID=A0AAD1SVP3_PELCU|nr:FYN-binding -like [Pelobates cultripes]CAH2310475.1 FYN-binding -like [Pelobates cultripes]
MESVRDVNAIRKLFQNSRNLSDQVNSSQTKPEGQKISNIRSNPTLQNVISFLEDSQKPAPPLQKKPEIAAKPFVIPRPTSVIGPVTGKPRRESTGSTGNPKLNTEEMKLSKNFRCTLHIMDSPKKQGDKICDIPPPVYNKLSTPNGTNHHDYGNSEECYETIDPSVTNQKPLLPPSKQTYFASSIEKGVFHERELNQSPTDDLTDYGECYEIIDPSISNTSPLLACSTEKPDSSPMAKHFIPAQEANVLPDEVPEECYEIVDPCLLSDPQSWKVHQEKSPSMTSPKVLTQEDFYVTPDPYEVSKAKYSPNNQLAALSSQIPSLPGFTSDGECAMPASSNPSSNFCEKSEEKTNHRLGLTGLTSPQPKETQITNSHSVPRIRPLPPWKLMGSAPEKPSRPPSVDLQIFLTPFPTGTRSKPVGCDQEEAYESSVTMHELERHHKEFPDVPGEDELLYEISSDLLEESGGTGESDYKVSMDGAQESRFHADNTDGISFGGSERQVNHTSQETRPRNVKIGKAEETLRKRFQITGSEIPIYTIDVKEDGRGGKDMLEIKKGDLVDIIQTLDCPPGKWLARNDRGNYGFVMVDNIDVYQAILHIGNSRQNSLDVYDDIESGRTIDGSYSSNNSFDDSQDLYEDASSSSGAVLNSSGGKGLKNIFKKDPKKVDTGSVSPTSLDGSANNDHYSVDINDSYNREKDDKRSTLKGFFRKATNQIAAQEKDGKMSKVFAKEEKIFRDKFKYSGDIVVSNTAIVTEQAITSPKGKYGLLVKAGERLDVIDVSSENLIICRNAVGKFGFVSIEYLNFESGQTM